MIPIGIIRVQQRPEPLRQFDCVLSTVLAWDRDYRPPVIVIKVSTLAELATVRPALLAGLEGSRCIIWLPEQPRPKGQISHV